MGFLNTKIPIVNADGTIAQHFLKYLMEATPIPSRTAEPTRLYEGLTVIADGTDWNPGAGQGVYTYYGAAWHKLG